MKAWTGLASVMGCPLLDTLVALCPWPGPLTLLCGVGKHVPGARRGFRTPSALGLARQLAGV